MNTCSLFVWPALRSSFALSAFFLSFNSLPAASSPTATASTSESGGLRSPDGPTDYQLFAGVDLSADDGSGFHRIVNVSGESMFLEKDKEQKKVWSTRIKSYRMVRSLKLSETLVSLSHLSAEPTYSPGSDPQRAAAQRQIALETLRSDNRDLVQGRGARSLSFSDTLAPPGAPSKDQDAMRAAEKSYGGTGGLDSSDAYARARSAEMSEERYDAIDYTFALAAPHRIERPYMVAIASITVPEKPEVQFDSIYARSLDEIDQKERTIHVMHVGLPPGFKLKSYRIHVFDNATELATTSSEQRLPLAKKDAELYIITQYIADHKTETLAARKAVANFPQDFSKRIDAEQLKKRFVLTISPIGEVSQVQVADAASEPVDEYVAQTLKGFRFYPALNKGKPVEGQVRVKFGDFL